MPGCESVVEELLVAHVGIDWGEKKHHVSVCGEGRPGEVTSREVGARPESLQEWLKGLLQQYPEGRIAVYLESCRSGLRYFLMGYQRLELYLIATTASRHYRKMFYPSGAKSDPRDSELLLEMGYRHRDRFRFLQNYSPSYIATFVHRVGSPSHPIGDNNYKPFQDP